MNPHIPAKKNVEGLKWSLPNAMYFPHALRAAIPEWADSLRCLNLASISGNCSHTVEFGRRVKLTFQVEESGKLSGKFLVFADIDLAAAKGLATALQELIERVESKPSQPMVAEERAFVIACTGSWPEKS